MARKARATIWIATNTTSPDASAVRPVAAVNAAIETSNIVRRPIRSAARRIGTLPSAARRITATPTPKSPIETPSPSAICGAPIVSTVRS